LPLTQALASRIEKAAASAASSTPPPFPFTQPPPTWDEVRAGRGEPLVTTYLFLVRELAHLNAQLESNSDPAEVNYRIFLPPRVPGHRRMIKALREARTSLQNLKGLLSRP
jgi:hypothetical protein